MTPTGCERAPIDAAAPSTMGTGGNIDIVVAVEKITPGSIEGKIDRDSWLRPRRGLCAVASRRSMRARSKATSDATTR